MIDMKNKYLNYILITIAMGFWSLSFIQVEFLLNVKNVSPVVIVFGRLLLAAIILNSLSLFRKERFSIDSKSLRVIALMAFCEPFMYFLGESFALKYINSSVASIIIATIPLFLPFFSYAFFKEKVKINQIIGTIISFAGVLFIIIEKDLTFKYSIKGLLLLMLAVFSAIGYAQFSRLVDKNVKPLDIVRFQNIFSTVYFLPIFLFYNVKSGWSVNYLDMQVFVNILILALLPSSIAFIIYNHSFRILGVNTTNLFSNLIQ